MSATASCPVGLLLGEKGGKPSFTYEMNQRQLSAMMFERLDSLKWVGKRTADAQARQPFMRLKT